MINIIIFDIIFIDVYPALVNAIIVLLMLFLILFFNKARVIDVIQRLTSVEARSNVLIKRRIITLGITILVIIFIFAFDSFIEHLLGGSKEKII